MHRLRPLAPHGGGRGGPSVPQAAAQRSLRGERRFAIWCWWCFCEGRRDGGTTGGTPAPGRSGRPPLAPDTLSAYPGVACAQSGWKKAGLFAGTVGDVLLPSTLVAPRWWGYCPL